MRRALSGGRKGFNVGGKTGRMKEGRGKHAAFFLKRDTAFLPPAPSHLPGRAGRDGDKGPERRLCNLTERAVERVPPEPGRVPTCKMQTATAEPHGAEEMSPREHSRPAQALWVSSSGRVVVVLAVTSLRPGPRPLHLHCYRRSPGVSAEREKEEGRRAKRAPLLLTVERRVAGLQRHALNPASPLTSWETVSGLFNLLEAHLQVL